MPLPIAFIYLPTRDLDASLHLFRDVLGHDELWREGDDTVGLGVPGSDVALMLDRTPGTEHGGPGPGLHGGPCRRVSRRASRAHARRRARRDPGRGACELP